MQLVDERNQPALRQPAGRCPTEGPGARPRPTERRRTARTETRQARHAHAGQQNGTELLVHTALPTTGQQLSLAVDTSQLSATMRRLIALEVAGGLLAVALAGLLLGRVVGRALRPLDHMTSLAQQIAAGDLGRRLRTGRNDTELGRTAIAFDAMLDELEAALA